MAMPHADGTRAHHTCEALRQGLKPEQKGGVPYDSV